VNLIIREPLQQNVQHPDGMDFVSFLNPPQMASSSLARPARSAIAPEATTSSSSSSEPIDIDGIVI